MSKDVFSLKNLLDQAVRAAALAKEGRMDRAQVARLSEILELEANDEDAIYLVMAFITRQVSRGEIPREAAKQLTATLNKILGSSLEHKKEHARRFLGLFRWSFEALREIRVPMPLRNVSRFEDLLKGLGGI